MRGARLNVGMLDDNKEWIQKFSRSQYNYRATALNGSPWHLPFSRQSVVYRVSREMHVRIYSFVKCRRSFLTEVSSGRLNSGCNKHLEYHRADRA